jgi:hypothetical protein
MLPLMPRRSQPNPIRSTALAAVLGLTLLGLPSCGGTAAAKTGDTGPNGGFVVSLAHGKAFLDVVIDPAEPAMRVFVLDGELGPKRLLDPIRFQASGETFTGVAAGESTATDGASEWVFVGEAFAKLPHGDFVVALDGKDVKAHLHPVGAEGH